MKKFMRYVAARLEQESRDLTYRIYMSDAAMVLAHLDRRYADIFKPEEKRSADEIKASIVGQLQAMAEER